MAACILVVDDDEIYRVILRTVLTRKGFIVAVASGVAHAREVLKTFTPDLLVLDVIMRDGSGLDFCAALRQDKRTKSIPIILFSGNDDLKVRQQSILVGAHAFVSKSETHTKLVSTVQALLETHFQSVK